MKTKVLCVFGENDPGLVYLRTRIGHRIKMLMRTPIFNITEVIGMDHPMHRHTKRPIVRQMITDFVNKL
jgi:hypothetical protein